VAVNIKERIHEILQEEAGGEVPFSLDHPEVEGRGDYSSNIALARSRLEKRAPLAIAEDLALRLKEKYADVFVAVEVANPGFLNFYLSSAYIAKALGDFEKKEKSQKTGKASVEYISANPTGPLHIGNARGGPIGDVIAHVLSEVGCIVTKEYFHNDAGAQIGKFADSLWHWYLKALKKPSVLPEGGYEGEYVSEVSRDIAKKYKDKFLKNPEKGKLFLADEALKRSWADNSDVMKKLGISFNKITKESALVKSKTKAALAELQEKDLLFEKDGATWFRYKNEQGEDKESVVIKSDGAYVYFANDIAYHKEKFAKNDYVVDVLGEGHQGHIPKLEAVADAFGFSRDNFKIVVHGQVTLVKGGEVVSMSKRKGNFVTAREVLEAVGKDAFRYFMLQYAPRSGMQFDLSLAKEKSKKNPVYYIQYAHARACSILAKSTKKTARVADSFEYFETEPEMQLIKKILELTEITHETARDFQVQRLAKYAYDLAASFTRFYETTRVVESGVYEAPRLALVALTQKTLAHVLGLLGISAPKKM